MTVVPDAPWWANILLVLTLATLAIVPAMKASRQAKVVAETAHSTSARTEGQLQRVLHNVENSHNIGLRDDLDEKVSALATAMETVSSQVAVLHSDVGSVHEELRNTREDVGGVHQEMRGIRQDERLISQRITALERGETVAAVVHAIEDSQADSVVAAAAAVSAATLES